MQYVGGKYRVARHIEHEILKLKGGRSVYLEPFVGGAATFSRLAPHFAHAHGYDVMPDLVEMWQSAITGWEPTLPVTEGDYRELKGAPPSAQRGFVGFGCSFGGKFFGGYARSRNGAAPGYDYAAGSARSVKKQAKAMRNASVDLLDYRAIRVVGDEVIYCDPPYAGTTGYNDTEPFDSEAFWSTAECWASLGAVVFVSEYEAPDGWSEVWQKPMPNYLRGDSQKAGQRTERLFVNLATAIALAPDFD